MLVNQAILKMPISPSLETVHMFGNMAKRNQCCLQMKWRLLISWSWDKKVIMKLSKWTIYNSKHPYNEKIESKKKKKRNHRDGNMFRTLLCVKMEDGSHEPRNVGSLSKLKKTRKWILPQEMDSSRRNAALPMPQF